MGMPTDAVCMPAKCGTTKKDFYMMYYKAYDGKWVLTYGKEKLSSQSGGSGSSISVQINSSRIGPQYKCPHCGNKHTFTCWNCGKRTCFDGDIHEGRVVVCAHCGETGVFRSSSGGGGNNKPKDIKGFSVNGQI